MKLKNIFFTSLTTFILLYACGGSDGGPTQEEPEVIVPPSPSNLIFPENNTECNTGEILNDTQSRVNFQWTASENTDTYEINIINLNTNNVQKSTSIANQTDVNLLRGVPYEWYVISKANSTNETAESSRFRFYNEGIGVQDYAPFPAVAIKPTRGQTVFTTSDIQLEWSSSDLEDDELTYEVYLGTNPENINLILTTTENTTESINLEENTTYYWRIKTIDQSNNTSISELFEFKIN
ncbi:hypothetical protein [Flavobacterium sp. ASW18X]|uniref:hypothetical protein n=1 Tax=Flavobacterium sp. ASW18X TaxID=2572595 RepID=UPI0010ADCDA4|nr:hypothetical protein [Flavobacterium sp. ASW18X]TKD60458.1 hypothetical protein FBT53_12685 [Flavobacterium sp. ASW18X]